MYTRITLAHGNGGQRTRELIDACFHHHLGHGGLNVTLDAVPVPLPDGELIVTTDGFTVLPLEFPGGNLGQLAAHGTINDLAVAGADPLYLTVAAILEEGLSLEQLHRLIASLGQAVRQAGARVVAGDTKVVERGAGSGLYLAITGLGVRNLPTPPHPDRIQSGDKILLSGPMGDHGTAVLLARQSFGLGGTIHSDCASVLELTRAIRSLPGTRFMRDPTRGGVATVCHELTHATGLEMHLHEAHTPVRPQVRSLCEILGYDPWFLACEGRVVAVVSPQEAEAALAAWRALPAGHEAALIGDVGPPGRDVILTTSLGGERCLEELEDDPLPRIC